MSFSDAISETMLFDGDGGRKYVTSSEAKALHAAARSADEQTRMFFKLLHHTGARISEALAVTLRQLDAETCRVVLRTLKRRRPIYRAVPVPPRFMKELLRFSKGLEAGDRLFPWSRQTGWRRIRTLMELAGIEGTQAKPRGLRHGFGCRAIESGLPESLVGRLLGHAANSKSTRIYTHVLGPEERALIGRMWREP